MLLKRLTRKSLPMLAAAALLGGPLVATAQASGQAAAPAAAPVAGNPDHIKVLTAALKNMHDNYKSFANFTPGPQDISTTTSATCGSRASTAPAPRWP